MPAVTLSNGDEVHIRDVWTHKASRSYMAALKKDVVVRYGEDGASIQDIPAENLDIAQEAAMPYMIEKVMKGGKEHPFSQDWLDGLPEEDFRKIESKMIDLRSDREEGKKNS